LGSGGGNRCKGCSALSEPCAVSIDAAPVVWCSWGPARPGRSDTGLLPDQSIPPRRIAAKGSKGRGRGDDVRGAHRRRGRDYGSDSDGRDPSRGRPNAAGGGLRGSKRRGSSPAREVRRCGPAASIDATPGADRGSSPLSLLWPSPRSSEVRAPRDGSSSASTRAKRYGPPAGPIAPATEGAAKGSKGRGRGDDVRGAHRRRGRHQGSNSGGRDPSRGRENAPGGGLRGSKHRGSSPAREVRRRGPAASIDATHGAERG